MRRSEISGKRLHITLEEEVALRIFLVSACYLPTLKSHTDKSGWITAFCYWDGEGKCFYRAGINPPSGNEMPSIGLPTPVLTFDEARYHRIETSDVPPGYAAVPVEIYDNGRITDAQMVAGSVGMRLSSSGLKLDGNCEDDTGIDTIQPGSGRWMYEVRNEEEILEEV